RVAVEPGGHDLRADPAGQRIAGDQGVAGEQGSPGFEEQHGVAWCVPGDVHCTGFAWDVENLVVSEGGHLHDWDDLCALAAGERDHRSVELRARQVLGQAGVTLSWLGPLGYRCVVLVDPYARGPLAARSLCKADMVRVGVSQYHRVQVAQATPERVERSQEQPPVPRRAGIDERQATRLFDKVEVGNSTCEPTYPRGNLGCGGLWCVRHVTFLSCIWRRTEVTRLRSFSVAQPSGRSPSDGSVALEVLIRAGPEIHRSVS